LILSELSRGGRRDGKGKRRRLTEEKNRKKRGRWTKKKKEKLFHFSTKFLSFFSFLSFSSLLSLHPRFLSFERERDQQRASERTSLSRDRTATAERARESKTAKRH